MATLAPAPAPAKACWAQPRGPRGQGPKRMEPQMEKPFASLVDAETTDQTLPSERALTQTDVTAYMEFKQSGFQEEADWDRTLLGDGEDSSEADSDQEEVHGAHGMWDDGEVAAEQDPLSTIPGATSSTTLRATAQACQRGLVAKKIDSSNNFEFFFDLRLHNRQKDRRGIAHFSVGGVVGSQLPRICVAPNSTHLWIFIRHGHFRAKLATRAIPLNQTVKVRFRLLQNKITVDIDNRIEGILEAEGLHIPVPAKVFAYFNGPGDKAADATVSGAVYRWRHFALRPRVQATTIFELPPDEIQLMREVTNEIQKARRWATFDAIFGLVVLVNAIAMGVRIDCQCGSDLLWQVLDNIFLIAFIIEFCLRAAISGIRHFGIMLLSDSWIQFDFLVVCLSIVDTWVLGGVGSGGVYTLARLYRLLKLVKMVRVLRAFRQLAMLVEGILSSLQTLFWAVLLLGMTIFILSVLLVTMSQWNLAATTAILPDFTTLPSAMWTLIQVATFDRWVTIARTAAFDLGEAHGTAIAVVILLSACITGLGLMNLVVGILCNTAFKLEARQSRTQGAERLVSQQEALELFRQQLLKHGTYLLKNNRQISKEEFTQALEDSNIKALLRILDLGPEDFKALAAAFEEDGNVEIDGIIEAIGIIELQSYFTRSIANSVKKDKARTALRPVDLLFFTVSLRQLETSMVKIERSGRNLCAFAYDVLSVLYTRAENSFTLLRLNNDVKWAPPGLKSEVAVSSLDVRKMEETANQFNLDSEEQQLIMPIDVLFGSMIVINGAFVGIQATQNDDNTLIYWIDLGFTIIFTIEFILRGILQAGLNYVHQPEDTDTDFNFFEQANRRVSRFSSLRSRMRCWIFPPCPPGGVQSVLAAMCLSLKEFSVLFDFVIIVLSLLDSLVIVQLRNAGVLNLDTSALSVLRAFRLFRLAKLLRVFKLFPQLQKMVFALIETWRQVCWALVLILLVLYAFSIYAVTIVGNDAEPGSPLKKYFGDLRSALLTGWQVTTFDHWGDVLTVSKSNLLNLVVLLLLAVVLGLGLMNMVIGVLCESALGLQAKDEAELQRGDLITFLTAMKNLQEACGKEFGEQLLYANMLERTTGLKMHSKLQPGSEAIERFGSQRTLSHPSVSAQNGQSVQAFQKKLEEAFEKAGLHRLLVKRIFDKVDHGRLGYMTVDDLTKGALVVKEDLAKVELYGCMAALRDVRAKCVKMNECIMKVHVSMQRVLEEMCAVIHRRYQKEMLGSSPVPNPTDYDASNLCPEAEQALIEMCKWFGEGSLPHIVGMGSLRMSTGTGKVTVLGDEVVGSGTAFRTEVQVGDIILIEPMVVQKSGDAAAKKTLALAVAVVLSQSRLKIAGFMLSEAVPDYVTFVIARAGSPQEEAEPARAPFSGTTASVPKHMSPRSAQHLFEWDLQTQRRDVVNLREAEAENLRLQKLKKEADAELEMVLQRPLMIMCLQAWKSQIKPRQKTVSLLW